METVQCTVDGKSVGIETGRLAKQSNGAVLVTQGKAAVLVTVNNSATFSLTKRLASSAIFPLSPLAFAKIY